MSSMGWAGVQSVCRQHQDCCLFKTTGIYDMKHDTFCWVLPPMFSPCLLNTMITQSPSELAYCKQSKTGVGKGLKIDATCYQNLAGSLSSSHLGK